MTESFILGLTTGSACLTTCGMTLVPYFVSGNTGTKRVSLGLGLFLLSRLIIYISIGILTWYLGQALFSNTTYQPLILGTFYIIFSAMLITYAIGKGKKQRCPLKETTGIEKRYLIPVSLGVISSLSFCPAMLIAVTSSVAQTSVTTSILVFVMFFIGTSVWFIPLPLLSMVKDKQVVKTVAMFATAIAGAIYLFRGVTTIIKTIL
ncbi:MAG: sulfite exporter TauE/SafE family protein [Bacteroidales bacterium]|jgi:hypothetical protein|nr:sulfite exporter TauE/SafE family protein [Bacteroidales bacterium]